MEQPIINEPLTVSMWRTFQPLMRTSGWFSQTRHKSHQSIISDKLVSFIKPSWRTCICNERSVSIMTEVRLQRLNTVLHPHTHTSVLLFSLWTQHHCGESQCFTCSGWNHSRLLKTIIPVAAEARMFINMHEEREEWNKHQVQSHKRERERDEENEHRITENWTTYKRLWTDSKKR